MAEKKDLLEDLNYNSQSAGERMRVIDFGIIAIWWSALVGKDTPHEITLQALTGPAVLGALAIFLDLIQYIASYFFSRRKLYEVEQKNQDKLFYDTDGLAYRIRQGLFYTKMALTLIGLLWFVRVLLPFVFPGVTWSYEWSLHQ